LILRWDEAEDAELLCYEEWVPAMWSLVALLADE